MADKKGYFVTFWDIYMCIIFYLVMGKQMDTRYACQNCPLNFL